MEINQADRDALRRAQHNLNPSFRIGNIIEHQVQDPKKYKRASREAQGLNEKLPQLPKINYKSSRLCENDQTSVQDETPRTTSDISQDQQQLRDLPIQREDIHANMWLNMDTMEYDKLEWMTDRADRVHQEKLKTTTHFDREGRAIAPNGKVKDDEQIHDIESLVKLLDSTYQPQVTYSLNVISKIATLAVMGYYDGAFDENIHQILLRECLLRVRRHIDNPNETICQSALKCLRSLLCNTPVDEVFLDRTHSLHSDREASYWLQTNKEELSDEKTDKECVEMDAILALVARTDILTRFQYLLKIKTGEFSETYKDCIIDILLRIARHSREMCSILMNAEFHKVVIDNFMPLVIVTADKPTQSLAFRAVKLVRLLAHAIKDTKFKQPGNRMFIPNEIMKPIECYYYIDCYNALTENDNHLFVLHVETLRLMTVLLLTPSSARKIFDVVMMNLDYLIKNLNAISKWSSSQHISSRISLDWQLAANLFDLLANIGIYEVYNSHGRAIDTLWTSHIAPILKFWIHHIVEDDLIPHLDVSIAIATAVRHAEKDFARRVADTSQNIEPLLFSSSCVANSDERNFGLTLYNHLLSKAAEDSHLSEFLKVNGNQRDPKMLASFGYLNYNTSPYYDYKFNNMIENNSPFILLNMYASILAKGEMSLNIDQFTNNLHLARYIGICAKHYEQSLEFEASVQESYLMQYEIEIMANLIIAMGKSHLPIKPSESQDDVNKTKFKGVERIEHCPNLMFNAFSLVPLISPDIQYMVELKEKILRDVIFHEPLLKELEKIYMSKRRPIESMVHDPDDELSDILDDDHQTRWKKNLQIMKDLYLPCYQPNRFWVLQPIIEYYVAQNKHCDETKKDKSGHWFFKAIQMLGDNTTDANVFGAVLSFNRTMMLQSPPYSRLVVCPNLDEIICLIGSVFLDEDLFLDEQLSDEIEDDIRSILSAHMSRNGIFSDASKKIQSLDLILVDYFNKIVDHFEAASYGDRVFSNFLLLFLNPKADKVFKKKLLSEKVETCLSQIRLSMTDVWCFEMFKDHKEQDPEIRTLIKAARPYVRPGSFLSCYTRFNC